MQTVKESLENMDRERRERFVFVNRPGVADKTMLVITAISIVLNVWLVFALNTERQANARQANAQAITKHMLDNMHGGGK